MLQRSVSSLYSLGEPASFLDGPHAWFLQMITHDYISIMRRWHLYADAVKMMHTYSEDMSLSPATPMGVIYQMRIDDSRKFY